MSSPGETPSSVLRETLLEFSRLRRKERKRSRRRDRDRTQKHERPPTRSPTPSLELQLPATTSRQLELAREEESALREQAGTIQDSLLQTILDSEKEKEQYIKNALKSKEKSVAQEGTDLDLISEETKRGIYLTKHETSSKKSLQLEEEVRRNECACSCCAADRFYVPPDLRDGDKPYQTQFIQRVFFTIFIKSVVVVLWLKTVEFMEFLRLFYEETYLLHIGSAVTYFLVKVLFRASKNFRKRHWCLHFVLFLIELAVIADFVACVMSCWMESYFPVPRKVFMTIAGVCLFFMFVGYFVNYDITDGIMIATALIVTCLMTIHQVLHVESFTNVAYPSESESKTFTELMCSLAVFLTSELFILVVMIELKSILTGRRFSPRKTDWFFTSIYII